MPERKLEPTSVDAQSCSLTSSSYYLGFQLRHADTGNINESNREWGATHVIVRRRAVEGSIKKQAALLGCSRWTWFCAQQSQRYSSHWFASLSHARIFVISTRIFTVSEEPVKICTALLVCSIKETLHDLLKREAFFLRKSLSPLIIIPFKPRFPSHSCQQAISTHEIQTINAVYPGEWRRIERKDQPKALVRSVCSLLLGNGMKSLLLPSSPLSHLPTKGKAWLLFSLFWPLTASNSCTLLLGYQPAFCKSHIASVNLTLNCSAHIVLFLVGEGSAGLGGDEEWCIFFFCLKQKPVVFGLFGVGVGGMKKNFPP